MFIVVEGEFKVSRKEHFVGDFQSENTARQFLGSDLSQISQRSVVTQKIASLTRNGNLS